MKPAYKVIVSSPDQYPQIIRVDVTDVEGVSWREAKKRARAIILDEARGLRSLTEKEFNKEPHGN